MIEVSKTLICASHKNGQKYAQVQNISSKWRGFDRNLAVDRISSISTNNISDINIIFNNILEYFEKCASNITFNFCFQKKELTSIINFITSFLCSHVYLMFQVFMMVCTFFRCYWYFFLFFCLFFCFNFLTAIPSVSFLRMKVDVEVIIKDILVVTRFLLFDVLLFAFVLLQMVHFLYVQICLTILLISFSATLICIDNRKRIECG